MTSQYGHRREQAFVPDKIVGEYERLCVVMDGFAWYQDQEVLELINNGVPATCKWGLDIGCGSGIVLRYLAEKRHDIHWIGIDKASEMIARAKSKCARFENVSLEEMDWKKLSQGSFARRVDFILLKNVLHLIVDVPEQLRILLPLLTKTGRILVVETVSPNADSKRFIDRLVRVLEKIGIKKHIFTARELVQSVKRAGLDVQKVQYHDQFIDVKTWINAKALSPSVGINALSYLQSEMHSETLRTTMKYEPPEDNFPGKMLRRQIFIQCIPSCNGEATKR